MIQEIFLASASPRRRELIAELGLPFVCASPEADESVPAGTSPRDAAMLIARRKAEAARQMPEADGRIIVSADTIVVVDDQIYGKPADRAHAAAMLRTLSGREHQVMTGVCVVLPDGTADSFCECTGVRFYPLSDEEIVQYIDSGEPMDKAGGRIWNTEELIKKGWMDENGRWKTDNGMPSEAYDKAGAYGIQGIGKLLVEGISGDYFNVVGLPVARLRRFIDGMTR